MNDCRPVEVSSNQFYRKGWFYGFTENMYAVVEYEDGTVDVVRITEGYSLKFFEPKKMWEKP